MRDQRCRHAELRHLLLFGDARLHFPEAQVRPAYEEGEGHPGQELQRAQKEELVDEPPSNRSIDLVEAVQEPEIERSSDPGRKGQVANAVLGNVESLCSSRFRCSSKDRLRNGSGIGELEESIGSIYQCNLLCVLQAES